MKVRTPKQQWKAEQLEVFQALFARLPDAIVLAIGLRVFTKTTLADPQRCVAGWVFREALALERLSDPEEVSVFSAGDLVCDGLHKRFGGDWEPVFAGVVGARRPVIEEALFDRIMEASR